MNRTKTALCAALLPALILVAGCSPEAVPGTAPTGPTASSANSAEPTGSSSARAQTNPVPNDLEKGPLRRTYQSAGQTVTVAYSADPSVDQWTPNGSKSIRLFLSVANKSQPSRKIYMTRASVRVAVRDANGEIQGPEPVFDTSNLLPGYLVTSPNSYNQSFSIPPLDDSAVALTLAFKFETVTLVDKDAKDYTKQTSTDTLRLPVKF